MLNYSLLSTNIDHFKGFKCVKGNKTGTAIISLGCVGGTRREPELKPTPGTHGGGDEGEAGSYRHSLKNSRGVTLVEKNFLESC